MTNYLARHLLLRAAIAVFFAFVLPALPADQSIEFESNGLQYQTLTRNGVTVMFAALPTQVRGYGIVQATVTNGSSVTWTVKPEDFTFYRRDGSAISASSPETVVSSFLDKASRQDVIKLLLMYESSIYALSNFRSTNGYEQRRQAGMAQFVNPRFKAAAAASAVVFIPTKLKAGDSTDGAVFFPNNSKSLGAGRLVVRAGGEKFEFESYPELRSK